jgi:GNAT superfamily N-acetyltransferase
VAGLLELDVHDATAGIVVIGLVPAYVGCGFGGSLLTLATQLAWGLAPRVDRVLVQTSSRDHRHALPNYERRGFRVVRA